MQVKIEPVDEISQNTPDVGASLSNDVISTPENFPHPEEPSHEAYLDKLYEGPILVMREDKSEHFKSIAAAMLPSETVSQVPKRPLLTTPQKRKNDFPGVTKSRVAKKSPKRIRLPISIFNLHNISKQNPETKVFNFAGPGLRAPKTGGSQNLG